MLLLYFISKADFECNQPCYAYFTASFDLNLFGFSKSFTAFSLRKAFDIFAPNSCIFLPKQRVIMLLLEHGESMDWSDFGVVFCGGVGLVLFLKPFYAAHLYAGNQRWVCLCAAFVRCVIKIRCFIPTRRRFSLSV